MAKITRLQTAVGNNSTGATNPGSAALPSTAYLVGDLAIVEVTINQTTSGEDAFTSWTVPTGWTTVAAGIAENLGANLHTIVGVFRRSSAATVASTFTATILSRKAAIRATTYRGVTTGATPVIAGALLNGNLSTLATALPGGSINGDDALHHVVAAEGVRTLTTGTAGFTALASSTSGGGGGDLTKVTLLGEWTDSPGAVTGGDMTISAAADVNAYILQLVTASPAAPAKSGTAAISQSSSTAATGRKAGLGTAAISQTHGTAATGKKGSSSTAAISQTSTVAATGQIPGPELSGVATISQPNTGTATGRKQAGGTAAIAQSHSATATGFKEGGIPNRSGAASISQAIATAATGRKTTSGAAAISQAHVAAATGREGGFAAPSIIQASSVAATGRRGSSGAGSISVAHTITASGHKGARGAAVISQPSSSVAVGPIIRYGVAAIAQTHTLTAAGQRNAAFISTFELMQRMGRVLEPPPSLAPANLHLTISGVKRDVAGSEPFTYKPNTLYVWMEDDEEPELSAETSRQNFVIRSVYVADALDEEPQHRRRRDVSMVLDTKRKEYLDRIEAAMSGADWEHITGSADWDAIRALEGRGIAVLIRGYRLLSIA